MSHRPRSGSRGGAGDGFAVEQNGSVGDAELVTRLRQAGVGRGDLVGLAVSPDGTVAVAADAGAAGALGGVGRRWRAGVADEEVRPRWVTWSQEDAQRLVARGVRLSTCWDVAAVHRLLFGGWRADPGFAWAHLRGLPLDGVPAPGPAAAAGMADLFDAAREEESPPARTEAAGDAGPVGADGYLRLDWTRGGWAGSPERLLAWARLARQAAELQRGALEADTGGAGGGAGGASGGGRRAERAGPAANCGAAAAERVGLGRSRPCGLSRLLSCCAPSCPPMGCRWTGTPRSRCSPGLSGRGRAGMPRRRRCARRGMARCCGTRPPG